MSSTINASTASGGGVVTTADASGILQLQTAGTTAVTIDASQNVGIGTSSPNSKLTISSTTAYQNIVSTTTGNASYLVLQNSADSSNAYVYATGKELRLSQADTSASSIVTISTQNAERMRIDSSGNVGIGCAPSSLLSIQKYNPAGLGPELILNNSGNSVSDSMAVTFASGAIGSGARGQIKVTVDNNPYYGIMTFSRGSSNATLVESMRIDASGRLLIGTTAPIVDNAALIVRGISGTRASSMFEVQNTSGDFAQCQFVNPNGIVGSIRTNGTATSYSTSSDQRLKENIVDAPSALNSVNAIKVRSFDWKSDGTHVDYGYIAQELLKVAPEAVSVPEDSEQMMGVDFGKLTPRLVKAIQELKAIIDTQNARIEALEAKI